MLNGWAIEASTPQTPINQGLPWVMRQGVLRKSAN